MTVVPPDYDSDPERWRSWEAPQDVHEMIAPELRGPVLDVGCGEGRLASLLTEDIVWIGVDSSPGMARMAAQRVGPALVLGNCHRLPFADASLDAVSAVWCG